MTPSRRRFLRWAAATVAAPAVSRGAAAQGWPSQPLRWVVGFPPGGSGDIVARIMAAWLAERLGQPVVIENKPGASTNISIQTVVNAPADGNTLLFIAASAALNVSLFDNLPFNLQRDIAPVAGLIDFPLLMLTHPSLPAKTIPELIAYAKANPGKISIASFGTGTTSHVAGELFKMTAGVEMTHIPYRGGAQGVNDVIGGHLDMFYGGVAVGKAAIASGHVKPLAVTGETRSAALPDVPTFKEAGVPEFDLASWTVMLAPKGTPADIVALLRTETLQALADPKMREALAAQGVEKSENQDVRAFLTRERDTFGRALRTLGITMTQ